MCFLRAQSEYGMTGRKRKEICEDYRRIRSNNEKLYKKVIWKCNASAQKTNFNATISA